MRDESTSIDRKCGSFRARFCLSFRIFQQEVMMNRFDAQTFWFFKRLDFKGSIDNFKSVWNKAILCQSKFKFQFKKKRWFFSKFRFFIFWIYHMNFMCEKWVLGFRFVANSKKKNRPRNNIFLMGCLIMP